MRYISSSMQLTRTRAIARQHTCQRCTTKRAEFPRPLSSKSFAREQQKGQFLRSCPGNSSSVTKQKKTVHQKKRDPNESHPPQPPLLFFFGSRTRGRKKTFFLARSEQERERFEKIVCARALVQSVSIRFG